ncbi:hypothetical protein VE02_07797 [Pseudogymnoascus sp. 03VT05]|nr:hypothetical protein VE02_07797 [Pseudogymnoascus sp. 03VT05]
MPSSSLNNGARRTSLPRLDFRNGNLPYLKEVLIPEFSSRPSFVQENRHIIVTMPARKTSNKPRRNSAGNRKSVSPKRTAPVRDGAAPVVNSKIVTCERQRMKLPGWGVNGWKLFTTKFIFQIVEVKSKAEDVAAQLAVAL